MFAKGVEAAIRDAIERGEFDQLPGAGKRVDLSAYFETPEDLRLAYSMLKNAGFLPQEAELTRQISALEERAELAANETERQSAARQLQELRLRFSMLMERMSRKGITK